MNTEFLILAHPADSPILLIGAALLMIVLFVLLERNARKRARDAEQKHDGDA